MTASTMKIVVDAHALLRFLQDEEGAEIVEQHLKKAHMGEVNLYMSEINLGEVYYMTVRRIGVEPARVKLNEIRQLSLEFVPTLWSLVQSAAELKAEYAVSYADCFAAATAMDLEAVVMTGDPEFKKLARVIEAIWV